MSGNDDIVMIEEEFENLVYESEHNDSDDNQSDCESKDYSELNTNNQEDENQDDRNSEVINMEDLDNEENINFEETEDFKIKNQRMLKLITKYEKVKMIGIRTMQLEYGAKPKINWKQYNLTSPYEIACKEFELKIIPFSIRRYVTRDFYSDFKLKNLEFLN